MSPERIRKRPNLSTLMALERLIVASDGAIRIGVSEAPVHLCKVPTSEPFSAFPPFYERNRLSTAKLEEVARGHQLRTSGRSFEAMVAAGLIDKIRVTAAAVSEGDTMSIPPLQEQLGRLFSHTS